MTTRIVRAIDPGTANLKLAWRNAAGGIETARMRNCFLSITPDDFTRKMLTTLNVAQFETESGVVIAGDPAHELAATFGKTTRRPMHQGVISPGEADAIPMIGKMVERLLKVAGPVEGNEKPLAIYSIPASPVDMPFDIVFHKSIIEGVLGNCGYEARPITEGHAVVLSELGDEQFTGIGISLGGGMVNACVAYRSVPVITFSTTRAGDYIDIRASQATGEVPPRIATIKEKMDLGNPKDRYEFAIQAYYRDVLTYAMQQIAKRFSEGRDMPKFQSPVTIVASGGTAAVTGFVDLFRKTFEEMNFPIPIKEVRVAKDPIFAVVRGALVYGSL